MKSSMTTFATSACVMLAMATTGCESTSTPGTDASTGGSDSGTDASTAVDAQAAVDAPMASTALHGCDEADFVDRTTGPADSRMIMVPRGTNTFDFPCMTIRAGQAVMFMWSFGPHPLAPGVAPGETGEGTEPSPIEPQTMGALYEPVFETPGTYPFYCTSHAAGGMVGVVRVIP
jgi:plastocyanin